MLCSAGYCSLERWETGFRSRPSSSACWVPCLHKLGVLTVSQLGATESAGRLQNDLAGLNKKYKLDLHNPSVDEVKAWVSNAAESTADDDNEK